VPELPDFASERFLRQFERLDVTKEYCSYLLVIAALMRGWTARVFVSQTEANIQTSKLASNYSTASFFSVNAGNRLAYFRGNLSAKENGAAHLVSRDKGKLKFFLSRAKVNSPFGGVATTTDQSVLAAFNQAGIRSVTVKPLSGTGSRGVRVNQTLDQAAQLVRQADGEPVLIEQQLRGTEYRVHVVGHRVVSALRVEQPSVLGNGIFTLRQLIEAELERRKRHPVYIHRNFNRIELEKAMLIRKEHPARIVAKGESVPLSLSTLPNHANRVECLAELPSAVAEQAVKATRAIGSRNNGIDLILDRNGDAFVIDMDSPGGIWYQCFPYQQEAWNLDVPNALLDQYLGRSLIAPRRLKFLDFVALKEELFRPGRKGRGVNAADFAEFE
jgi:D-alanine-D-alanine ligase-like ATP-grasp enzyme